MVGLIEKLRFLLRVRATLSVLALLLGAGTANAGTLNFDFSVTNTIGTVSGTFTGEIFGLTDNATSAATSVLIESFPAGMNSLDSPPIDATLWDQQYQDSFVVSNGQIVDGGFWAAQTINGFFAGFQLFLNATAALQPFNYLNLDGINSAYIWGDNGLAAAHFTQASSVPEPASLVSAVVGAVCLIGCCARRHKMSSTRS